MAVKIERIDDLEELGSQMKIYGESITEVSNKAHQSIIEALEGSKGEAIQSLQSVLTELNHKIFQNIPDLMASFSQALLTYHVLLKDAGFDHIVKSTLPEVENYYCRKVENEQLRYSIDEATMVKRIIDDVSYALNTVQPSRID